MPSVACLDGTTTVLGISNDYARFVNKGTGLVANLTGHAAYRLDLAGRVDTGQSWQLPVLLAHLLASENKLAAPDEDAALTILATGEVDRDQRVRQVSGMAEKIERAAPLLAEDRDSEHRLLVVVPKANAIGPTARGRTGVGVGTVRGLGGTRPRARSAPTSRTEQAAAKSRAQAQIAASPLASGSDSGNSASHWRPHRMASHHRRLGDDAPRGRLRGLAHSTRSSMAASVRPLHRPAKGASSARTDAGFGRNRAPNRRQRLLHRTAVSRRRLGGGAADRSPPGLLPNRGPPRHMRHALPRHQPRRLGGIRISRINAELRGHQRGFRNASDDPSGHSAARPNDGCSSRPAATRGRRQPGGNRRPESIAAATQSPCIDHVRATLRTRHRPTPRPRHNADDRHPRLVVTKASERRRRRRQRYGGPYGAGPENTVAGSRRPTSDFGM